MADPKIIKAALKDGHRYQLEHQKDGRYALVDLRDLSKAAIFEKTDILELTGEGRVFIAIPGNLGLEKQDPKPKMQIGDLKNKEKLVIIGPVEKVGDWPKLASDKKEDKEMVQEKDEPKKLTPKEAADEAVTNLKKIITDHPIFFDKKKTGKDHARLQTDIEAVQKAAEAMIKDGKVVPEKVEEFHKAMDKAIAQADAVSKPDKGKGKGKDKGENRVANEIQSKLEGIQKKVNEVPELKDKRPKDKGKEKDKGGVELAPPPAVKGMKEVTFNDVTVPSFPGLPGGSRGRV